MAFSMFSWFTWIRGETEKGGQSRGVSKLEQRTIVSLFSGAKVYHSVQQQQPAYCSD